jgi:peptidoglycan hydrolase-like protein with peptidoglycan-binding domain
VATYEVTIRSEQPEAATTIEGVQRRLRALGYQIGNAGDDKIGVDGKLGPRSDRAIHDFQADHKLVIDGNAGSKTQGKLDAEI